MAGFLGGTGGWVKRGRLGRVSLGVLCLGTSLLACGGGSAPGAPLDPFAARIARCLAMPRPVSDADQDTMISVPAGPAVIGSTLQERAAARALGGQEVIAGVERELPRRVELIDAFRIDRTPVTNQAYAEFVAACGRVPPDVEAITPDVWASLAQRLGVALSYDEIRRFVWPNGQPHPDRVLHPVVLVTHEDAGYYCAWRGARLPTELEWERAARGDQGQQFPWGGGFDASAANTRARGLGDTTPVAAFELIASPVGAKDMGGLVFEWTSTSMDGRDDVRVVKSNSWNGPAAYSRGAARGLRTSDVRDIEVGFRCAADPMRRVSPDAVDVEQ